MEKQTRLPRITPKFKDFLLWCAANGISRLTLPGLAVEFAPRPMFMPDERLPALVPLTTAPLDPAFTAAPLNLTGDPATSPEPGEPNPEEGEEDAILFFSSG